MTAQHLVKDLPERLAARFDVSPTGCWLYRGCLHRLGYARTTWQGKTWQVHRITYTILVGPIPEGLELDHLCKVRHCANPAHLEPVTHLENIRRGARTNHTHCRNGHPWTPENIYVNPARGGFKTCRVCMDYHNNQQKIQRALRRLSR